MEMVVTTNQKPLMDFWKDSKTVKWKICDVYKSRDKKKKNDSTQTRAKRNPESDKII